jgi:hypothetical protein
MLCKVPISDVSHYFSNTSPNFLEDFPSADESSALGLLQFPCSHTFSPQTRKFLSYKPSIRISTFRNHFGNTNTVLAFCSSRDLYFLFSIVRKQLKRLTNHTAHSIPCCALHTIQDESPDVRACVRNNRNLL